MLRLSNNIVIMGILAGGAITSLSILNNNHCRHGGNAWLAVAVYNAQTWLREEYMATVMYMAGGKAKTKAPFTHQEEKDALYNTNPNDPCKFIEKAIEVLRAQIEWRYTDLNPKSKSYKGHKKWIKKLEKKKRILEDVHDRECK